MKNYYSTVDGIRLTFSDIEEVDADLLKWILNTARVAGQSF